MNSTDDSDWWKGEVNWDTPAGRLLRRFFQSLPSDRRFRFTLYGSAPLQLTLDASWISADVDLFSGDDEDLTEWVRQAGLSKEQTGFYLEPGFQLSFKTSPRWLQRARVIEERNLRVTIPHPLDILIGKLDRLDAKDLAAFKMVQRLTGHPSAGELQRELQIAVDLFRPSFDDESPNRYAANTVRLWREMFNLEIDVAKDVISPALARRRVGYGEPPPDYKSSLER